jgi:alpha-D-ribose 1-methylphosphonate 5-triphosphate synthase subunit PhnH
VRPLGIDPVHDTRRTFDGLLSAMSRPGTIHTVPEPADHAVVATLVDHEVRLATDDQTLRDALADQGRLDAAPPDTADIVHARDPTQVDVCECPRGSLVEPSDGATIIYRVELLADDAAGGTHLTVSGPGVAGTATLTVGLPETALSALADAQADYPRGVDAVFATESRLAAIPRSATMEVA